MWMVSPPAHHSAKGSPLKLLQALWAVVLACSAFTLGALSPMARYGEVTASSRLAAAAAASAAAGGCQDWGQVDLSFDVMAASAQKQQQVNRSWVPLRRPGFQAAANPNQALYDKMWTGSDTSETYQKNSCWGCRFVGDVVARLDFDTVLDAGTGNGGIVRAMQLRNKVAFGIELSQAVLERDAPDLLRQGLLEQGSLTDLPYQDSQFDLVFSADVLEHILPEQVDDVVRELVRVARRHIVMSISLKSYDNDQLHTLLRPRHWWEAKFEQHGAKTNRPLVWALQQKENRFKRAAGELYGCRMEGSEADGGKYEVCVATTTWLVGRPGQEVRAHRCITTSNAELEPWMFAFTVGNGDG